MSRRYLATLMCITLAAVIATFIPRWAGHSGSIAVLPFIPVYFGVVTAVQHYLICRSMHRSPKLFVQVFLGSVVGVLFLHLTLMAVYLFTQAKSTSEAYQFTLWTGIFYLVYLVFETVAIVRYVSNERQRRKQE